jgi:hypothetical protein
MLCVYPWLIQSVEALGIRHPVFQNRLLFRSSSTVLFEVTGRIPWLTHLLAPADNGDAEEYLKIRLDDGPHRQAQFSFRLQSRQSGEYLLESTLRIRISAAIAGSIVSCETAH